MRALPSGTITFLFTDIEGSTSRWDRDRRKMEAAVRRHDAILRAAIDAAGGVVFKTIGDAFCAAFARPEDAIDAAYRIARGLAREDFTEVDGIRVRAALHTGTADERDRDYFGPAVNRVARLLSIAWGEQTILSQVTASLARDRLPPGLSLGDLGEHRLKDLAVPEHVYELRGEGLRRDFPPLRSLRDDAGNLPYPATSFVGRERESADAGALLEASRVVTIAGPGGIGKTRLAIDVARSAAARFPGGVWLVELAPISSGALLLSAFANALGIALPPESDALEAIVRALDGKTVLLVVDNCEHLIEPAAAACAALLRRAAGVRILATSRQRLGIQGEHVFAIPQLSMPSESEARALDVARASSYGAIALFVERARAIDRRFALTEPVVRVVAAIVRRLDGIALAIELAVPRLKMLGLEALRSRLDERFRLLTGGRLDTLPHHQTLRATIDWSYDLLDARERQLFRRCAVFVDGFSLEAAVAVAGEAEADEFGILDTLSSLVEKSLIVATEAGMAGVRYTMLETTQAYARERLEEASEINVLKAAHAAHFAREADAGNAETERTGRPDRLLAQRDDLENFRAAFEWSIEHERVPECAIAIATAATGALWDRMGLGAEWIARCRRLIDTVGSDRPLARARIFATMPVLYSNAGLYEPAVAAAAAARAEARSSGDREMTVRTSIVFANAATLARRFDDARAALGDVARDGLGPVLALQYHGARSLLAYATGDLAEAADASSAEIRLARARGDVHAELIALINAAEIESALGRYEEAISRASDVLGRSEDVLGREARALAASNLASYFVLSGRTREALDACGLATRFLDAEAGATPALAWPLGHAALAHAIEGHAEIAATLLGFCDAILSAHATERGDADARIHRALLDRLAAYDERARAAAYERGRALPADRAISLAAGEANAPIGS